MVFLDTCIWMELCSVKTPVELHEKKQAELAGDLLEMLIESGEKIITCREQLLEMVSAVQKAKLREYNRTAKAAGGKGFGSVKEFKKIAAYGDAQELCRQVLEDVLRLSELKDMGICPVEQIVNALHLVDINDYIYYYFCREMEIPLYTFDLDYESLDDCRMVHIMRHTIRSV